jgi:hypothetical protein
VEVQFATVKAEEVHRCRRCKEEFTSNNKLHRHIRDTCTTIQKSAKTGISIQESGITQGKRDLEQTQLEPKDALVYKMGHVAENQHQPDELHKISTRPHDLERAGTRPHDLEQVDTGPHGHERSIGSSLMITNFPLAR